jgi:homoserine dehydrogenase
MQKQLKIGLFGFGCVGGGLYEVLQQTPGFKADILKICVKDRKKKRPAQVQGFTFDKDDILADPEINLVVELIDDPKEAFEIVKTAMQRGKAVVSANKKMIAEHMEELHALQQAYKVPFLYEASVCGSIPVIRNLEEYYDNDLLSSIAGICNGTTNYILTRTIEDNRGYEEVLRDAQALGFAESDPTLDVEGFDAKYKLVILIAHTFGLFVAPEEVYNLGISTLGEADVAFAREKGLKIKLLSRAFKSGGQVLGWVMPTFVTEDDPFYNVHNEYNAVKIGAAFTDSQLFVGKGAGSFPTASAVLSDISAISYGYRYEYKKALQNGDAPFSNDLSLRVYLRYEEEHQLEGLAWEELEVAHKQKGSNYIIGKINLADLIAYDPKARGVFAALYE